MGILVVEFIFKEYKIINSLLLDTIVNNTCIYISTDKVKFSLLNPRVISFISNTKGSPTIIYDIHFESITTTIIPYTICVYILRELFYFKGFHTKFHSYCTNIWVLYQLLSPLQLNNHCQRFQHGRALRDFDFDLSNK